MSLALAINRYIENLVMIGPHCTRVRELLEVPLRYLKARQGDQAEIAYPVIFEKLFDIWGHGYIRQVFADVEVVERPIRLLSEDTFKTLTSDLDTKLSSIRLMDSNPDYAMITRITYSTLMTIWSMDIYVTEWCKLDPKLTTNAMRGIMTSIPRTLRTHFMDFEMTVD